MTAIGVIVVIGLCVLLLWLVPTMPSVFRKLLYAVAIIVFVLWVLSLLGVFSVHTRPFTELG
jgi:hypothetical protein